MPTENDPLIVRKDSDDGSGTGKSTSASSSSSSSSNQDTLGELKSNRAYYNDGKGDGGDNDDEDNRTVVESVITNIAEFTDDLQEEAQQVADNFIEELEDADGGDLYFFDMALTRNLSILPQDVVDVADAHQQFVQGDEEEQLKKSDQTEASPSATFGAYALLAVAVMSLSSIGPLLELQGEQVSPTMKIQWRMLGTAILLTPFAAMDVMRKGLPKLTRPQWTTFFIATFSYVTMGVAFVLALKYTAVGNCVILGNSLALILLVGKICVGDPVSFLEGTGAVIAFAGAALCSKDSNDDGGAGSNTILGDGLAILSALGGVGYLVFAKTTRPHLTLYVFTWLTMTVGCAMCLLFQILVMRETVSWDTDRPTGVFGFLSLDRDRLPLELIMVVICNCLGTMGYVRAMIHFDNLVISVAGLLEPVCAVFIAFGIGVGVLPGWKGWLGNMLVAVGTFAVVSTGKGSAH